MSSTRRKKRKEKRTDPMLAIKLSPFSQQSLNNNQEERKPNPPPEYVDQNGNRWKFVEDISVSEENGLSFASHRKWFHEKHLVTLFDGSWREAEKPDAGGKHRFHFTCIRSIQRKNSPRFLPCPFRMLAKRLEGKKDGSVVFRLFQRKTHLAECWKKQGEKKPNKSEAALEISIERKEQKLNETEQSDSMNADSDAEEAALSDENEEEKEKRNAEILEKGEEESENTSPPPDPELPSDYIDRRGEYWAFVEEIPPTEMDDDAKEDGGENAVVWLSSYRKWLHQKHRVTPLTWSDRAMNGYRERGEYPLLCLSRRNPRVARRSVGSLPCPFQMLAVAVEKREKGDVAAFRLFKRQAHLAECGKKKHGQQNVDKTEEAKLETSITREKRKIEENDLNTTASSVFDTIAEEASLSDEEEEKEDEEQMETMEKGEEEGENTSPPSDPELPSDYVDRKGEHWAEQEMEQNYSMNADSDSDAEESPSCDEEREEEQMENVQKGEEEEQEENTSPPQEDPENPLKTDYVDRRGKRWTFVEEISPPSEVDEDADGENAAELSLSFYRKWFHQKHRVTSAGGWSWAQMTSTASTTKRRQFHLFCLRRRDSGRPGFLPCPFRMLAVPVEGENGKGGFRLFKREAHLAECGKHVLKLPNKSKTTLEKKNRRKKHKQKLGEKTEQSDSSMPAADLETTIAEETASLFDDDEEEEEEKQMEIIQKGDEDMENASPPEDTENNPLECYVDRRGKRWTFVEEIPSIPSEADGKVGEKGEISFASYRKWLNKKHRVTANHTWTWTEAAIERCRERDDGGGEYPLICLSRKNARSTHRCPLQMLAVRVERRCPGDGGGGAPGDDDVFFRLYRNGKETAHLAECLRRKPVKNKTEKPVKTSRKEHFELLESMASSVGLKHLLGGETTTGEVNKKKTMKEEEIVDDDDENRDGEEEEEDFEEEEEVWWKPSKQEENHWSKEVDDGNNNEREKTNNFRHGGQKKQTQKDGTKRGRIISSHRCSVPPPSLDFGDYVHKRPTMTTVAADDSYETWTAETTPKRRRRRRFRTMARKRIRVEFDGEMSGGGGGEIRSFGHSNESKRRRRRWNSGDDDDGGEEGKLKLKVETEVPGEHEEEKPDWGRPDLCDEEEEEGDDEKPTTDIYL